MTDGGPLSEPATPDSQAPSRAAAFEFVRELAAELSARAVELPSFPEVALRVQRVLSDETVALERVVRVIGAEPGLATRVLQMANSAALHPGGRPIADLRAAIARLGFDLLRSAAISFAMVQLQRAQEHKSIAVPLRLLWQRSVRVATTSLVVARHAGTLNADEALLAGLLHNVGRLYVLTRAARHPMLFEDAAGYAEVVRQWHVPIARALLENWRVADELVEAICTVESDEFEPRGPLSLADVLATAQLVASLREQPELLAARITESRCAARLGVKAGQIDTLLAQARSELQALEAALGA